MAKGRCFARSTRQNECLPARCWVLGAQYCNTHYILLNWHFTKGQNVMDLEYIKSQIVADFKQGTLWWRVNNRGNRIMNRPLGAPTKGGYLIFFLQGRNYFVHKVLWALYYDTTEFPEELDHFNGIVIDNSISNLRPATKSQNSKNCRGRNGKRGVSRRGNRWYGRVKSDHITYSRGFDSEEEADAWCVEQRALLHGAFASNREGSKK